MEQQVNIAKAKPDVLMLALARHDGPYSSTAWSLAKSFARESRVIYIDNPFTLVDYWRGRKTERIKSRYTATLARTKELLQPEPQLPNLQVLVPPITLPINWLPRGIVYRWFNRLNNWIMRKAVNKVLKSQAFKNYLYINSFNPFYGAEPAFELKPAKYIYQTVDNIEASRYVGKHGPELEKVAMQKADFCVATSRVLQRKASKTAKKAIYIPNAADVSLFRRAVEEVFIRPAELQNESRKIICYMGHIDHRLDYTILEQLAQRHLDKLILMIGPVSGDEYKTSGLSGFPNVVFIGQKSLQELPAYLQHVHCTIIPFKCNELTASIYPLKINEYLAAGKPVIASPFSEDIEDFKDLIKLKADPIAFAEAVGEAIEQDTVEAANKRTAMAAANTWENRVEAFWQLIGVKPKRGIDRPSVEERRDRRSYEKAVN